MRKTYIVKNQRDFTRIIKNKQFVKNSSFVIYYENNNLPFDRYGVSVGTKLGNAVFRNKFKRKIRAIVDIYKKDYINSKDYIIILRESGSKNDFNTLQKDYLSLIQKIGKDN